MSSSSSSSGLIDPKATYVQVKSLSWTTAKIDICSGLAAPILMAPFIAIVDTSIIKAAMDPTSTTVAKELKKAAWFFVRHPIRFLANRENQFMMFLCWKVYAGTYASVNLMRSYDDANRCDKSTSDGHKFMVSFAANVALTQVKDGLMVKALGRSSGVRVTLIPRLCFLTRDAITMVTAFCVADRIAEAVRQRFPTIPEQQASLASNFVLPAALQTVTTLFHLLGLNYTKTKSVYAAWPLIREQYPASLFGRICRIIPAVSIGNNINKESRNVWLKNDLA